MASSLVFPILLLPETSADYILLQRAKRLRKLTGDSKYLARSEIKKLKVAQVFINAIMKPTEIAIKDPAIGFVTIYGGIVYATYYSFFEVRSASDSFPFFLLLTQSASVLPTRLLRSISLLSWSNRPNLPIRDRGFIGHSSHLRGVPPVLFHSQCSGCSWQSRRVDDFRNCGTHHHYSPL